MPQQVSDSKAFLCPLSISRHWACTDVYMFIDLMDMDIDHVQCRLRGRIDTHGCIAAYMEERLNLGVNFLLSAEVSKQIFNFCHPPNFFAFQTHGYSNYASIHRFQIYLWYLTNNFFPRYKNLSSFSCF